MVRWRKWYLLPLQKGSKPFCKQYCCCFSTSKEAQSPHIRALIAGQCQYHTHVDYLYGFKMSLSSFTPLPFPFYCLLVHVSGASSCIQKHSGSFRGKVHPMHVFTCISPEISFADLQQNSSISWSPLLWCTCFRWLCEFRRIFDNSETKMGKAESSWESRLVFIVFLTKDTRNCGPAQTLWLKAVVYCVYIPRGIFRLVEGFPWCLLARSVPAFF